MHMVTSKNQFLSLTPGQNFWPWHIMFKVCEPTENTSNRNLKCVPTHWACGIQQAPHANPKKCFSALPPPPPAGDVLHITFDCLFLLKKWMVNCYSKLNSCIYNIAPGNDPRPSSDPARSPDPWPDPADAPAQTNVVHIVYGRWQRELGFWAVSTSHLLLSGC